jgi:hypothetical protein
MAQSQVRQRIPTSLTLEQFEEFVLPHLPKGSRGPQPKLSLQAIFNYILKLLYLGCQWKELPIVHYSINYEKMDFSYGNTIEVYVKYATSSNIKPLHLLQFSMG